MIVEIKSGNQLPIYDINKNKFIGFIHNAYFDCEKGELVFVSIKSGMLSSTKMVSSQDLSFGPDGLGTKTKEYLKVDTDKLKKYSKIIGQKVETEDGVQMGKVQSVFIESNSFFIYKLEVVKSTTYLIDQIIPNINSGFIIDRDSIVKITTKEVIVKNNAYKTIAESEKSKQLAKA